MIRLLGAAIFGWTLGQPLPLPACQRAVDGMTFAVEQAATCQENYPAKTNGSASADFIVFPADAVPSMMSGNVAEAQIEFGKLVEINFDTRGAIDQEQVLNQLTAEFGKADQIDRASSMTSFGAAFPTLIARWRRADVTVDYESAITRLDRGIVVIRRADLPLTLDFDDRAPGVGSHPL